MGSGDRHDWEKRSVLNFMEDYTNFDTTCINCEAQEEEENMGGQNERVVDI